MCSSRWSWSAISPSWPRRSPVTARPRGRTRGLRHELGRIAAEFDALWALTKRNISAGAAHRSRRSRWQRVQDRLHRAAPAARRRRHAPARARVAVAGRRRRAPDRPRTCTRPVLRDVDDASPPAPRRCTATSSAERVLGLPKERRRAALMDFELTSDQDFLQAAMRAFLRRAVHPRRRPRDRSRAAHLDRAAWHELGDIGVFSLTRARGRRWTRARCVRGRARVRGARARPRARPAGGDGAGRRAVVDGAADGEPSSGCSSRRSPSAWSSTQPDLDALLVLARRRDPPGRPGGDHSRRRSRARSTR